MAYFSLSYSQPMASRGGPKEMIIRLRQDDYPSIKRLSSPPVGGNMGDRWYGVRRKLNQGCRMTKVVRCEFLLLPSVFNNFWSSLTPGETAGLNPSPSSGFQ
ncbi:hypothetical protein FA13DRAFT_1731431 [Coprinellus micaceus]|uniref:Uncharacterized protein n=1 Tax=Coprinellus micaceus TaxID=71717 RepID=A0A4Y7TFF5_COPMI|nr:hypothetical protein FA13DRAFT_1731431 [Coprinellus micaceus]